MKRELLLALGLLLFAQAQAHASDWYLDVASRLGKVEAYDDTSFYLGVPWSNPVAISQTGRAGESCTFSQVQFVAPSADRRKEWIALLMTALAAGHRVDVFASCNSGLSTLVVSRLVISYN